MFSVQDFISNLASGGTASGARFDVLVTGITDMPEVQDGLVYRICDVSFPGRGVGVIDYETLGPTQAIGFSAGMSAVGIDVILSKDLSEKLFFERWQDKCVGYARSSMQPLVGQFDIGFYRDYIGTVVLRKYDEAERLVHSCTLIEAWPVDVGDVRVSWKDDSLLIINIKFAYRYYINDDGWAASQTIPGVGSTTDTTTDPA